MPSFASKIVEDSQKRFVFDDEVANAGVLDCANSVGGYFSPEAAVYEEDNGVPFRYYRIALPSKEIPRVSVQDSRTISLGKPWCSDADKGIGSSLNFKGVSASKPFFKDGLWMTDIRVPLYLKNGNSVALRKGFRLQVEFSGASSGLKPGLRGLSRVINVKGASGFGVNQRTALTRLRKAAANQTENVSFLAQFLVGDKNLGTFSEDGLYAVDYKSIRNAVSAAMRQGELESGIPVDQVCLFGSSPDTLSSRGPGEAARNPNQTFEIPIEIRDHSQFSSSPDGIFGEGDSVIFVGYGNAFWKRCDREDASFVNGKMDYFHSYSPYSVTQSFLLGWKKSGKGLRSTFVSSPAGNGKNVDWMRYVRAEEDVVLRDSYFGRDLNWEGSTGKEWFWIWHSRLDSTHVDESSLRSAATSSLPGLVDGGRQYLALSYFPQRSIWNSTAMVASDQEKNMTMSGDSYNVRMSSINFAAYVNGTRFEKKNFMLIPGGNYAVEGVPLKLQSNQYALDLLPNDSQYDRFDGYTVAYQWNPKVDSAEWLLPGKVAGVINVPAPTETRIMKFRNLQPVGFLKASNGVAKDSVSAEDDVRYLAVRENKFRPGLKIEGIPAGNPNTLQDLTRPNSKLEYLIVAPRAFVDGAVSLAEFRSDGSAVSSLATSVVALEDIYQMYGAGRVSPVAIRNYLSYVYSVCPNFKYVLLVGSGTFDYRGYNNRLSPNIFPPYEEEDGVFEDFYGVLDSGETVRFGSYDLDLAVGRIPAQSPAEFAYYVQKAKDYEKLGSMDYSDWRSNLLLAADDAFNNGHADYTPHTKYQENLSGMVDSLAAKQNTRWTMKKVYLLDYEGDAAGQKKDAAEDFINILSQGALFATYFGHGSKTDWAAEGLMKPSYIAKLSNKGRYTILGSFSCTVGRFDEGNIKSLSEEMLLAPGVGSIASIGATRETFASYNYAFGSSLIRNALVENLVYLGDAFLKAKGIETAGFSSHRVNNERYVLMGEPVIRMPVTERKIVLDQSIKKLQALDKVTLSGSVEGLDDGFVQLSLHEGRVIKKVDAQNKDTTLLDIVYDGALVYSEEVPVKNGRFSTQFVTPKKMSIGDTAAEFKAWAYSTRSNTIGRMWLNKLAITGISSYADSLKDTVPPAIQIQFCYAGGLATSFSDGQVVKLQAPACLQVVVEDSTAIDYREQADEGISFEIVGLQDPFHPWPYLEQNSKRAKMRMNFATEKYPAGRYVFKVRALDVLGNVSVKTLNVEITDDMEMGLADVFNAPNPMGKKGTTFYFKNLAVDRDSKVNIFIYNQNGRLVKVLKDAVSGVTRWNGRDEQGRPLANGLYHYVVRSEVPASENFGKKTWTKKQKLLISR